MKRSKKFAFGVTRFGSKPIRCPSLAASTTRDEYGNPILQGPIFYYDNEVIEQTHQSEGTISEEQARRAWFKAILTALDPTRAIADDKRLQYAKEGLEVAEKLGWLK